MDDRGVVPGPGDADSERGTGSRRKRKYSLLHGIERNKLHVFDWIDLDSRNIRAVGKSNPLKAIEIALDQVDPEPDVVFILSTDITGVGEYEVDQSELLTMIRRLNRGRRGDLKAELKTIQFIYEDPLGTLKLIADQNGGPDGYKFLSREELGLDR